MENKVKFYTTADVRRILQIGNKTCLDLFHRSDFPIYPFFLAFYYYPFLNIIIFNSFFKILKINQLPRPVFITFCTRNINSRIFI